jgi:hypothetical protein
MEPNKPGETGGDRDEKTGRFLPGNNANPKGRPKGFDFRRVVHEKMQEQNLPVEHALWSIFRSMLARASGGDVSAAKLLLDRLCESDPITLDVTHEALLSGPPLDDDFRQWASKFSQLVNDPASGT